MKKVHFLLIPTFTFFCAFNSHAEKLSYDEVLKDALQNAHEIKSANFEYEIRKEQVNEKRYGLFPDISIKINSEYDYNSEDNTGNIAVGDSVFSGATGYQNAASVNLVYPLIDYGAARKTLEIAETEASQGSNIVDKTKMEIETSILEKYAELYSFYSESLKRTEIISIHKKISAIEKRSNTAGISGKHDVLYKDIILAEELEKLDMLASKISVTLEDIGYLTGKKYKTDSLEVNQIPENIDIDVIGDAQKTDHTLNPLYKYYSAERKKRLLESEITKNDFYPKFNLYAKYNFYNSEPEIQDTYESMKGRGYSIGVFTSIPITEDFKRIHTLKKANLSLSKAEIEASKKLSEIERDFGKLKEEYNFLKSDVGKKKERLKMINSRHDMIRRLEGSKILATMDLLEEMIMLSTKEIELEKQITEQIMAMNKIIIQIRGEN